jgi:hypothetical protein
MSEPQFPPYLVGDSRVSTWKEEGTLQMLFIIVNQTFIRSKYFTRAFSSDELRYC